MDNKTQSISFIHKKPISCPVCNTKIYREEMLTGRGRMIAGNLTPELRRLYEPSKNYGEIFPIIYTVVVCPQCYYAAWREDFAKLPPGKLSTAKNEAEVRKNLVDSISDEALDFVSHRNLNTGLASYILATFCYDYHVPELSPIIKQGISTLRSAWLARDLHSRFPGANYDFLALTLYRKARFFYLHAIESENKGKQSMAGCPNAGPDLDKNYSFDGVLYVYGFLELHYGPKDDPIIREKNLMKAKQIVSRIFGMGKSSKEKPTALLDNARELHENIMQTLKARFRTSI